MAGCGVESGVDPNQSSTAEELMSFRQVNSIWGWRVGSCGGSAVCAFYTYCWFWGVTVRGAANGVGYYSLLLIGITDWGLVAWLMCLGYAA